MRPAPLDVAHRRTCRHCGDPIEWAVTEATGKSLEIMLDDVSGDLAATGELRETARSTATPVVRYVREGTGQFRRHQCGYEPPPPDGYEQWELEVQRLDQLPPVVALPEQDL